MLAYNLPEGQSDGDTVFDVRCSVYGCAVEGGSPYCTQRGAIL